MRKKISRKVSRIAIPAGLLLGSMLLTACSGRPVVELHPIETTDIILVEAGDTIVAPKRGAFLSDLYITEVMKARVRR